jgi:serine/threonine protein kinase
MTLIPGARIGPYEISGSLGAGGMGEVYRATDTNLGRQVAIKVLPEAFAQDGERLARFEREAKTLASLNHPNIAAIYGLDRSGRLTALVMELVEGDDLSQRIARGAIPVDDAVPIAKQIADALEAAHEQGIVHRDLKPANIKARSDGVVKVLDFGLAKAMEPVGGMSANMSQAPTITTPAMMTGVGMILGTAAYMSPEQAKGRTVDKRSDVWAFGCVLFEMLAGKRPFYGEDVSDTIAAVLRGEPDWAALPAVTPPGLQRLIRRCLRRDPHKRIRDIGDVRLELEELSNEPPASASGTEGVHASGRWTRRLPWALALVAGAGTLFLLVQPRQSASPTGSVARVELSTPQGVELFTGTGRNVAISPDGLRVVFTGISGGVRQIYVRQIDRFEAVPLRGTETASECCTFSADGRSIGFASNDGTLRSVSLADGLVATIATDAEFTGHAWGSDDSIVFVRSGALWKVASSGGEPTQLTMATPGDVARRYAWPTILPGATAILFASSDISGDNWKIESLVPATGVRHTVLERGTLPLYAPSGHLIFYRDGELLAAPFDVETQRVTGATVRILEHIPVVSAGVPLVDVSAAGVLAYAPETSAARLVWVSRQGAEQTLADTPRAYTTPRLDPKGRWVLAQAGDLWLHDLARSTFTRLFGGVETDGVAFPVLTPDGARVVFRTSRGLSLQALDGSGRGETIAGTTATDYPGSISPDGRLLLIVRLSSATSADIYQASLSGNSEIRPVLSTAAYEGSAKISPDGHWLAYTSNDSGRMEVYLRPFPAPDQRWQVSTEGGTQPLWNPNGREIFYRSGDKMMVVSVSAGTAPTLSEPRLLFETPYAFGAGVTIPNYDVSADGERFVMVKEDSNANRLNLVLNWFEELKRLVPVN